MVNVFKTCTLKIYAAKGISGKAERICVGENLQCLRHVMDGSRNSGKKCQRKQKYKDVNENLLHAV